MTGSNIVCHWQSPPDFIRQNAKMTESGIPGIKIKRISIRKGCHLFTSEIKEYNQHFISLPPKFFTLVLEQFNLFE